MFLLKPLFLKPVAEGGDFGHFSEWLHFRFHIAAFQAKNAIGDGVVGSLGDVFTHNLYEVGQWHDGTADDKVVAPALFFATEMLGCHIFQSDGFADGFYYKDFLA